MTVASAPASSANLGPGFDVLALALGMRCRVSAEPAAEWSVLSAGHPATDETRHLVAGLADHPHAVSIESDIPIAAGLGSSAALLVAASAAIHGVADLDLLFKRAAGAEGHPDNVAAATFGGLVAVGPDRSIGRLVVHPSLHVAVAVPDETLPTSEARSVLPPDVSRDVVTRTAARLVALVEGLRNADRDRLAAAAGDELHEALRSMLTPTPGRLVAAAIGAGAAYAAWSGAGPSVVAFAFEDEIEEVVEALRVSAGDGGRAFEATIEREGVRLE